MLITVILSVAGKSTKSTLKGFERPVQAPSTSLNITVTC